MGDCPLNMETFQQLLDLDEDDEVDREFSKGMVHAFFEQVQSTLPEMEKRTKKEDLATLSSLGHFLKGSAATIGAVKLSDRFEQVEYYGKLHERDTGREITQSDALARIRGVLGDAQTDFDVARKWLQQFYGEATS